MLLKSYGDKCHIYTNSNSYMKTRPYNRNYSQQRCITRSFRIKSHWKNVLEGGLILFVIGDLACSRVNIFLPKQLKISVLW